MSSLKVCTHCGFTWDEVQKKKSLGCPNCYEAFSDNILDLLKRVPGNEAYFIGSPPVGTHGRASPRPGPADSVLEKEEELTSLIQRERFEEAARVRDEIAKLKKNGSH